MPPWTRWLPSSPCRQHALSTRTFASGGWAHNPSPQPGGWRMRVSTPRGGTHAPAALAPAWEEGSPTGSPGTLLGQRCDLVAPRSRLPCPSVGPAPALATPGLGGAAGLGCGPSPVWCTRLSLMLSPAGFSSCATCLSTWRVRCRHCCGRPTGGPASATTTGELGQDGTERDGVSCHPPGHPGLGTPAPLWGPGHADSAVLSIGPCPSWA